MGNLRQSKTDEEWNELEEKVRANPNYKYQYLQESAPFLLEALEMAVEKYNKEMTNPFCMDWYKKARKAIAMAKGIKDERLTY